MKDENEKELYFGLAYWKKRWVGVPFFHAPPDVNTENGDLARFKVTSLNGQEIRPLARRKNSALETILITETIVPWLWTERELKLLCRRNNLPLSWVTDRFPREKPSEKKELDRREDRKIRSITSKEFGRLQKKLNLLNEQAGLIAGILWYLNNSLWKGGGFVTLEEILRMKVEDVAPEQNHESNWISLLRTGLKSAQLIHHCLPPMLWKRLCAQIKETSFFVFSKRDGGPLLPSQVDSYLKKAAKMAGFKEPITSASLRPQFDKEKLERISKKYHYDTSVKPHLEPTSSVEWAAICKSIPAILERKGRKPTHSPLDLLNAMLYLLRTRCPLRKLSNGFPPWRAVESQHRRWKQAGILDEIIAFRKKG